MGITGTVFAVVSDLNGKITRVIKGKNIVTDGGDLYYAQLGSGTAVTKDYTAGGLRLGTGVVAVAKGDTDLTTFLASTGKAETAGYPQVNNTDTANSGGGVDTVTWAFSYAAGDFTGTAISEGAIVDDIATPTDALCHFLFAAAFNITASDNMIVYVNHLFNGA